MSKKIFLSTIVISALVVTNIYAEAEVLETIMVTTATKTKKNIDGIVASVEVLTRKDIEKMGGESLKDIMSRVPGIHIQHAGGAGSSGQPDSSMSIRGINAKGTLILIDGRRIATEFKKARELNRIPASQIERIEVVKGPMSTLYGSDASGGVVNIITKRPKNGETEVSFGLRYGQNSDGDAGNKNVDFNIKSSVGKARYSIYANHTNTDPYTQNENSDVFIFSKEKSKMKKPSQNPKTKNLTPDSYNQDITYRDNKEITTYGARIDYDISDSTTVGFEFNGYDEEKTGTYFAAFSKSKFKNAKDKPIKLTNVPIDSHEDSKKLDLGVDLASDVNDDLRLTFRAYKSKFEKLSTSTTSKYKDLGFPNKAATYRKKIGVEADFLILETMANYVLNEQHLATFGLDRRVEDWDSNVFPGGTRTVTYNSAYLQDEWEIDETLNAILGLRYDDISEANNKSTLKIGVVKNFSKLLNLRFNFAQGYRAADVKELFVDRVTTKGVEKGAATVDTQLDKKSYSLKPEFTNSYEIGLSGRNNDLSYSTVLFFNKVENQIANVRQKNYFTYINISEAQSKGLELFLKYDISDSISSNISWTELRTENKKTGKDLEYQPDRVVSLNLDYQINENLLTGLSVKHTGEQYFNEVLNFGTPKQSKRDSTVNSYTTLDLTTSYDINKNFEVYGGVDNILDADVDDAIGSTVGTFIYVGMRAKY